MEDAIKKKEKKRFTVCHILLITMYMSRLLYVYLILEFIRGEGPQEKNVCRYSLYGVLSNMEQSPIMVSAPCETLIFYYSSLIHYINESIVVDILKDGQRSDESYYRIPPPCCGRASIISSMA
ncbi:hypothetical protein C922_03728 [Plasmodium inui San Antonio 1]|uniref:Uncharacterized protein n=1 Tax=Plasmodium inui San Antonio 1 TaxID=1237626 RepID=W7AL08_9APIC|nr:hypothetical protein C922_03728 [Plasmodium inui San Antonio 1]EUD66001.1 hypothetical protein C922_03728 [Plasmodium inui San Antonio 1]